MRQYYPQDPGPFEIFWYTFPRTGVLCPQANANPEDYSRTMPRVLGGSYGGGRFRMSEVSLYIVSLVLGPHLSL